MHVRLYVLFVVASLSPGCLVHSQTTQPQLRPAQRAMGVPDGGRS